MNIKSREKLAKLHPGFARLVEAVMQDLWQQGVHVEVNSGLRTFQEQDALYAQGRSKPGKRVTNARGGQSNHNYGIAVDLVPIINGQFNWDDVPEETWELIGLTAKRYGLEWGGDWSGFVDRPHVQVPGFTTKQMMALYRKGGLPTVWAQADQHLANLPGQAGKRANAILAGNAPQFVPVEKPAQPLPPPAPVQQRPTVVQDRPLQPSQPMPTMTTPVVEVEKVEAKPVPTSGLFATLERLKGLTAGIPAAVLLSLAGQWQKFQQQPPLVIAAVTISLALVVVGGAVVFFYFKNKQSQRLHDLTVMREKHAHELTLAQIASARSLQEPTVKVTNGRKETPYANTRA